MEYAAAASVLKRREEILAFMLPYMIGALISLIVLYVVSAIAMWKIFDKAGEKGWKGFVPFYNIYILFKISWTVNCFWIGLALFVGSLIVSNVRLTTQTEWIILALFICFSVALFVINCIAMYKLSLAYGKSPWFAIGLIFLNVVFLLILAFGSSKYQYLSEKAEKNTVSNDKPSVKPKSNAKPKPKPRVKKSDKAKSMATDKANAQKKASSKKETTKKKSKIPDYIDAKEKIEF